MKHVVWNEQANAGTLGPRLTEGINQVRAKLLTIGPVAERNRFSSLKGDEPVDLAAQGAFDATLRGWVKYFQVNFNRSKGPLAMQMKARLRNMKLIETGDIDWGTRFVLGIDEALATDDAIQIPDGVTVRKDQLTSSERKAASAAEHFFGSAYRVEGLGKLLDKLGLLDKARTPQEARSIYRVAPLDEGKFIVPEKHALYGASVEKSECAALVQCLGVSITAYWRRGPRLQSMLPEQPVPGTVIATLGTGVYLSDYSGRSHVGIFLGQNMQGLWMLDQYMGNTGNVGIRRKTFHARHDVVKLKPSQYFGRSHRRLTIESGNAIYGQDFRYETVSTRTNLTGDGSEYYILLDDNTISRKDTAPEKRPTKEEEKKFLKEFMKELEDEVFASLKNSPPFLREPSDQP